MENTKLPSGDGDYTDSCWDFYGYSDFEETAFEGRYLTKEATQIKGLRQIFDQVVKGEIQYWTIDIEEHTEDL